MEQQSTIRYLEHKDIQKDLWDQCIGNSANGLIYAYSNYLDSMTTNWDGLVLGDYEAVMPLPWRKKFGISYLYQPFLTAQLGLFSTRAVDTSLLEDFFKAIPSRFRYWDMMLNHQNLQPVSLYPTTLRTNYVLSLQPDYETIVKGYRDNIRRNIRKATSYGCQIKTEVPVKEVIGLAMLHNSEATEQDLENFRKLFEQLKENQQAVTYGVVSKEGALLASAVFLFSHQRAYYILVGNHPNGRTLGASHALIDAFIKDHAGTATTLDFEGSDIRNLAFFYSSFGANEEPYAAIHLNRLPWWMKWMKKS
jgi:hypothetical protein